MTEKSLGIDSSGIVGGSISTDLSLVRDVYRDTPRADTLLSLVGDERKAAQSLSLLRRSNLVPVFLLILEQQPGYSG